jgi:DNA-binding NtrC family response regulator
MDLELRRKLRMTPVVVNVSTQPTFAQDGVPQPRSEVPTAPVIEHPPTAAKGSVSALKHLARANREAEQGAILAALRTTNWNRRQAEVLLEVEYRTLLFEMRILSIRKEKPATEPRRARRAPIRRATVVAIGG